MDDVLMVDDGDEGAVVPALVARSLVALSKQISVDCTIFKSIYT